MIEGIPSHARERIHYMDAVRALAMLLGVFFHAGIAYAAAFQGLWPVGDMNASSRAMEVFVWFSHLFRMSLFFLIAGFFANLLIERRGVGGFLRNRAIRIVLPFVIFWPVISVTMLLLIVWALTYIQELPPILQLVAEAVEQGGDPPSPTTGHLWFLYYLTYFSLIAAVLAKFRWRWATRLADGFFSSTRHLLWTPFLLVPALYSTLVPVPAPESFVPQFFPFGYYGLFFLMGWHLFRRTAYIDLVASRMAPLVAVSTIGYVVYFLRLPNEPISLEVLRAYADGPPVEAGWGHLLDAGVEAYLSVYLTLVMLTTGAWIVRASPSCVSFPSTTTPSCSKWVIRFSGRSSPTRSRSGLVAPGIADRSVQRCTTETLKIRSSAFSPSTTRTRTTTSSIGSSRMPATPPRPAWRSCSNTRLATPGVCPAVSTGTKTPSTPSRQPCSSPRGDPSPWPPRRTTPGTSRSTTRSSYPVRSSSS